ncbi:hypothetical protein [Desulfurispira natronophila]|uniref:Uncharacterized protein n=1 Tax=Desulfurispira natronophila TaxID=682562 RepID=A0A7W7Y6A2_9BACT|nr:hypothetical protein [Desulfurispira natronophila]MBB5022851.1 hypothetical protein [Desulfurispira natronophila]
MKIKDVYRFYQDYIKPIYSEIEARQNDIPVELLFETYASFDHIKRYYLDGEDEHTASIKAISHLKRGVLDAFKLKLKYFNQDTEHFLGKKADLHLIDNGDFVVNFFRDKQKIIDLAKSARLTESKVDKESAFEYWYDTSLMIDEFERKYFAQQHKIEWAKKRTFRWVNMDTARGFAVGVASSLATYALLTVVL